MEFVHAGGIIQHVAQTTRRRFGQASLAINLMMTRAPNDKGSTELEELVARAAHAVIIVIKVFQGLVSPDEYSGTSQG